MESTTKTTTGGNCLMKVAILALVMPMLGLVAISAIATAAHAEIGAGVSGTASMETSLPMAFSTAVESVSVNTGTHAEYVEIYEDSSIAMLANETFEDARVLNVTEIHGFNTGNLTAYLQTVQQLDDGQIKQNIIIEVPQPSEESNDALVIYNIGAIVE